MARPHLPPDAGTLFARRGLFLLAAAAGLAGCGRKPRELKPPEEPKPSEQQSQPEQGKSP
ncbi:hypothetical protein [Benzoatithermus flavus]|uniref:Lipoprotein n=1 Tax=Benzoatithermus flavus TaxID=3108223 RepID=A0ABU8XRH1_9PROT